ncbi:hypothetical protein VBM87_02660 [Mycoplasma sp. 744]|uniref:MAG0110 family membrane protein n=1 Tax=Mycoplasma sp. 744 TaxID=3108531 RepID=UPI002B1D5809|nr:hypothetical protein [Mycoplasma sp. 744]MEA4115670.1 hypothetical protein [Mycoplasma sp. 744]
MQEKQFNTSYSETEVKQKSYIKQSLFGSAMMWFAIDLIFAFLFTFAIIKIPNAIDTLYNQGNITIAWLITSAILLIIGLFVFNRMRRKLNIIGTILLSFFLMSIISLILIIPAFKFTVGIFTLSQIILIFLIPAFFMFLAGFLATFNFFKSKFFYIMIIFLVVALIITSLISWFIFNKWLYIAITVLGTLVTLGYMILDFIYLSRLNEEIKNIQNQDLKRKEILVNGVYIGFHFAYDYIIMVLYLIRFLELFWNN